MLHVVNVVLPGLLLLLFVGGRFLAIDEDDRKSDLHCPDQSEEAEHFRHILGHSFVKVVQVLLAGRNRRVEIVRVNDSPGYLYIRQGAEPIATINHSSYEALPSREMLPTNDQCSHIADAAAQRADTPVEDDEQREVRHEAADKEASDRDGATADEYQLNRKESLLQEVSAKVVTRHIQQDEREVNVVDRLLVDVFTTKLLVLNVEV